MVRIYGKHGLPIEYGDKTSQKNNLSYKKKPADFLVFNEAPIDVDVICRGNDGYFYLFDSLGQLKKYKDIKVDETPNETGITWNAEDHGNVANMVSLPEGLSIFTRYSSEGSFDEARIYHLTDINSEPKLIYKSEQLSGESYWSSHNAFGIKSYYNGLNSYILAAVYGRGAHKKDLLLSIDGGLTFEVIKQTQNVDDSQDFNSHWHDVAFDIYNGWIWASEGDGSVNRDVHFSDNLGKDWVKINGNRQPTAVIPFPDKVVFGRDSQMTGLDYVVKPNSVDDHENLYFNTLIEFKRAPAHKYYAKSPVVRGNEAYLAFDLFSDEQPNMIWGTGDFGESWYSLFMGDTTGDSAISGLFDIDDEYIYAYKKTSGSVVYAKKPIWIM